jgi:hypothetical protein
VAGEGSSVTRFSPVSSAALDDTRLTGPDILVLAALGYHTDKTGWCWPSQDTIATRARLTRQTVSECMKRLVSFGHVERYIPDDGNLAKIRYRPVLDASSAPEAEQTQPVGLVGVTDKGGVALTDKPLSAETTSLVSLPDKACRPNRHKQEPSNKSKEQDNIEALFLEIWAPWERNWSKAKISRRGDGKAKTFEQFTRKARATDAAVIRSSALSFLAKADPQFLPGLSVWLNREGWDTGNVVSIDSAPRETDWPTILADWLANKGWPSNLGPKPHEPGYRGPVEPLRPLIAGKNPEHPVIAALLSKLAASAREAG